MRAVGWRNLASLDLAFDPAARLNVLFGQNAQGKTNVLEALYYLSTFRSFRTTQAADLIREAGSEAWISVEVVSRELARLVEARLAATGPAGNRIVTRTLSVDGKPVRRVSAAFGLVSVVLFVPEDLLLIRAAPAARRRFVDMAAAGIDAGYLAEAATFQKVLRSRNALLRTARAKVPLALLDTYDEQLAAAGARVVVRRRAVVGDLAPHVRRLFRALHGDLPVELSYESAPLVAQAAAEGDVQGALLTGLRERRAFDVRRGHTTFGPQTDDLEVRLDGRPARAHASQGQLRSLVLALKIAELINLEARAGEAPILLLDDVPSELDPERRRYLFETLATLSCQTMISVADRAVVPDGTGRADFAVANGMVNSAPQGRSGDGSE